MKNNLKALAITLLMMFGATGGGAQTQLTRRVIMEEYTGTWCSNCPRGIAAIQHLKKKYGDRFIAIAVHQDSYDPMKSKLYASASGYPSCSLSRMGTTDPFFGTSWTQADPIGIIHNIDYVMSQNCYGEVKATAQWTDAAHTQIEVTATSTFADGQTASDFALAFVVLEDSMHGEGYNWAQANQYVNDTDWEDAMPEMSYFVHGSNPQYNMFYNHVAVDGLGIRDGIAGSISEIRAWEPQTYTTIIDLSANTLIQNKDKLSIVALLLNKHYGDIENGDECHILPWGIETGQGGGPVLLPSEGAEGRPHDYDLRGMSRNHKTANGHSRSIVIADGKKVVR